MNRIYLVMGTCGDGDWVVKGFVSKDKAQKFCDQLGADVKCTEYYVVDVEFDEFYMNEGVQG